MSKLPRDCSGGDVVRAFQRAGWIWDRQKGSHVTLIKPGSSIVLTVPLHDHVATGTLSRLLKLAELSVEEFIALL